MKSLQLVTKPSDSTATESPNKAISYIRRVVFPSCAWAAVTASAIIGIGGFSLLDSPDWALARVYKLGFWIAVATLIMSLAWRTRYQINEE